MGAKAWAEGTTSLNVVASDFDWPLMVHREWSSSRIRHMVLRVGALPLLLLQSVMDRPIRTSEPSNVSCLGRCNSTTTCFG